MVQTKNSTNLVVSVTNPLVAFEGADSIENNLSTDVTDLRSSYGVPVKQISGVWNFVAAADIANATGVIVDDHQFTAADGEAAKDSEGNTLGFKILVRGPALLNKAELATVDILDAAINAANYETALEGLTLVVVEDEPSVSETQTT